MGRRSPDHGQEASSSPVFFLPLPASYITHTDRAPLKPEQQINTGSTQGRAPGSEGQSLKIQVNKQTNKHLPFASCGKVTLLLCTSVSPHRMTRANLYG